MIWKFLVITLRERQARASVIFSPISYDSVAACGISIVLVRLICDSTNGSCLNRQLIVVRYEFREEIIPDPSLNRFSTFESSLPHILFVIL